MQYEDAIGRSAGLEVASYDYMKTKELYQQIGEPLTGDVLCKDHTVPIKTGFRLTGWRLNYKINTLLRFIISTWSFCLNSLMRIYDYFV